MKCTYCEFDNDDGFQFCTHCGKPLENQQAEAVNNINPVNPPNQTQPNYQPPNYQPPNYQPPNYQVNQNIVTNTNTNGLGLAGFVISIISLFIGWFPFFGWIVWLLGLVFSIVGMFKQPRGFAIAGLVISLFGIILIILLFVFLGLANFFWYY